MGRTRKGSGSEDPGSRHAFQERVVPAFRVVDAILRGHMLPEPSEDEAERLGMADYDPELRYRVAKDTLEMHYGKPRQQIDHGGDAPMTLVLPEWFQLNGDAHEVIDGEVVQAELPSPEPVDTEEPAP